MSNVGSRSPSRWHDAARRRCPTHDEMQAEVLAFLRSRPIANLPENAIVDRRVEGEMPIMVNGQIVAFADAAEILSVNLVRYASLFEIKPQIDSVYAVVRQAKALLQVARRGVHAEFHVCHVVVPHDDPAITDLRAEWPHTWAWGIEFRETWEAEI